MPTRSCTRGGSSSVSGLDTAYAAEVSTTGWVRNVQWLPLPTVGETEEKIVLLLAIFPSGSNLISLSAGTCVVDWGDGTNSGAAASGTKEHEYTYSSISANEGTLGYRQVIITITPATNWAAATVTFQSKHSKASTNYNVGILDIKVSSPTLTSLTLGGLSSARMTYVEQAEINCPALTSLPNGFYEWMSLRKLVRFVRSPTTFGGMSSLFQSCRSLEELPTIDMKGVATSSSMFSGCYRLSKAPTLINTDSLTNVSNMFQNCSTLKVAPMFNTSKVTTFQAMFSACNSLVVVPPYDTSAATTMSQMFSGCPALVETPAFNTSNVTNFSSMFASCSSLKKPGAMDTSKATTMSVMHSSNTALEVFPTRSFAACTDASSMFSSCSGLQSVPDLNMPVMTTAAGFLTSCFSLRQVGTITTSPTLTNVSSMFQQCGALRDGPVLTDTSGVTNMSTMFTTCGSLRTVVINPTAVTNVGQAFQNCPSLIEVPPINLSNITNAGNQSSMINSCAVTRVRATGIKFTFDVANQRLGVTELTELFNNLATVTTQTLTITGNPGAAAGSTLDRTIATAKGWTVTG